MSSRDGQPPAPLPSPWGGDAPWGGTPAPVGPHAHTHNHNALPPALSGRLDAGAVLKGLRRHWVLAMTLGVICSGAAAFLAYSLMPAREYTAKALLRLSTSAPRVLETDARLAGGQNEFRVFQKTQETLVKSPAVLPAAIDKLSPLDLKTVRALRGRADTDPVTWLEDNLRVGFQGEVMTVSLSGERPKDLQVIVNAVVDSYMENVVNAEHTDRRKTLEKLESQLKDLQGKLMDRREEKKNLAAAAGGDNQDALKRKNDFNMEQLTTVRRELWTTKSELDKARIELEIAQRRQGPAPSRTVTARDVDAMIAADPTIHGLDAQIKTLGDGIEAASRRLRNPNSDAHVRESKRQLLDLQSQRAAREVEVRGEAERRVATANAGGGEDLSEIHERLAFYGNYQKILEAEETRLTKAQAQDVQQGGAMAAIEDAIEFYSKTVGMVGERVNELKVELDAPLRVTLAAEADEPRLPDSKKRYLVAGGAGLGTLAVVLLGISLLEYRVRRIDSTDAVARGLGMRLVGALPATPTRSRFALPGRQGAALQEAYWRSRLNESVNAIRTLMLRQSQSERLQVVMVTSASVGEGKTSLSCHLATSLARSGRRTLLLDFDLRNPTAHRVFDLPLEPGMCEVLRGQVPLEEVSHPIALGDLRMITAGRCDLQALHALGTDYIGELIGRLRPLYDFIVVDTPPVLPVADPLLIGQHVDAALFSILRDVSRAPKVHTACERLATLGVRVLGAVVAGTPLETSGSEYYYTAAYVNAGQGNNNDQENA